MAMRVSQAIPQTNAGSDHPYRRLNRLLVVGLVFALCLPPLLMPLRTQVPWLFPSCPSLRWFDRPCPLCGLTRGVAEMARGHIAEAQSFHPLAWVVFVLLLVELGARALLLVRAPRTVNADRMAKVDGRLHVVLAIAYLVYAAGFFWHSP